MQYAYMTQDTDAALAVKALRERTGLSVRKMAERMRMPPSTYGHYEDPRRFKGPYLPIEVAEKMIEAVADTDVSASEVWALASPSNAPVPVPNGEPAPNGARLVPVYDIAASAGHGAIVNTEDHISNLAFSAQYLREMTNAKGKQLAVIRVKGDSMSPTIQDDDMVMVDMTKINLDYDGLFVLRIGEALQIKRIGRGARRSSVMVIADNSLYPPVDTERAEIDVVGKVIWYGRKV